MKIVTQREFEKQVEIESAYLQHCNHLTKEQADKFALEDAQKRFQVED